MLDISIEPVKTEEYIHNSSSEKPLGGMAKRVFDISFALAVLFSATLIFAMIVVILKIRDAGPVFYSHERIGFQR